MYINLHMHFISIQSCCLKYPAKKKNISLAYKNIFIFSLKVPEISLSNRELDNSVLRSSSKYIHNELKTII